jgi:hypothetical protein
LRICQPLRSSSQLTGIHSTRSGKCSAETRFGKGGGEAEEAEIEPTPRPRRFPCHRVGVPSPPFRPCRARQLGATSQLFRGLSKGHEQKRRSRPRTSQEDQRSKPPSEVRTPRSRMAISLTMVSSPESETLRSRVVGNARIAGSNFGNSC